MTTIILNFSNNIVLFGFAELKVLARNATQFATNEL